MNDQKFPTIDAARSLLQKLVNARINKTPLPSTGERNYPVASLPQGQLLLSDGNVRTKPIMDKLMAIKEQQLFEGSQRSPQDYLQGLAFNIAVPASEAGQGAVERAQVFAKYLSSVLRPTLSAPSETGLPSLFSNVPPQSQEAGAFATPSALANLPQMAPQVESTFKESQLFNDLSKGLDSFKEALREDFRRQTMRGETETAQGSVQGNTPLVRRYADSYALPQSESAQYSRISANPFALTSTIR